MDLTSVPWWHWPVGVLAALLLVNGIPHVTNGISGRQFPTPFVGGPPNLDSAANNVLWGGGNWIVGGVLLFLVQQSLVARLFTAVLVVAGWLGAWLLARTFANPRRRP